MDTVKYNAIIREMIKNENEIRNQRTNWFLVIQGFLITGICQMDNNSNLHDYIVLIGIVTSLSFLYAAWRSTLAVSFAFACWKKRMKDKCKKKIPPISLITKEILETEYPISETNSWEASILKIMYPKNNKELRWDKFWNNWDWIMPYRILPILFFLFWYNLFNPSMGLNFFYKLGRTIKILLLT